MLLLLLLLCHYAWSAALSLLAAQKRRTFPDRHILSTSTSNWHNFPVWYSVEIPRVNVVSACARQACEAFTGSAQNIQGKGGGVIANITEHANLDAGRRVCVCVSVSMPSLGVSAVYVRTRWGLQRTCHANDDADDDDRLSSGV